MKGLRSNRAPARSAWLLVLAFGVEACAPTGRFESGDQRMAWWRDARFGMFIHWGLYAVPAGEYGGQRSGGTGEWIMAWGNIPRAEYEKFAPRFDPVEFDAAAWVSVAGDFGTPEQQIPPSGLPGVDWESCMTMNETWGYDAFDHNWKSAEILLHDLIDIASKEGNYLLNVGPAAPDSIASVIVLETG